MFVDYIAVVNPVRVIDVIVDELDLACQAFEGLQPYNEDSLMSIFEVGLERYNILRTDHIVAHHLAWRSTLVFGGIQVNNPANTELRHERADKLSSPAISASLATRDRQ